MIFTLDQLKLSLQSKLEVIDGLKVKQHETKFNQLKSTIDEINAIEFLNYYTENGNKDFKLLHFLNAKGVEIEDDFIEIIKLCTIDKINIINVNSKLFRDTNSNYNHYYNNFFNNSNSQRMVIFKRNANIRITPSYFNTRRINTTNNNTLNKRSLEHSQQEQNKNQKTSHQL
ncbi:hypothetical protein CYY_007931 [Polysphondylium violaceum]|uniref:Uncharacterized protein n=1 Tax=Polysphondylium violaceum TaxID=133409 RepID=A0A8J4PMN5_9MYCE|nr:hypothetical protein CYY_007931 [Polysphondylium violaceum]